MDLVSVRDQIEEAIKHLHLSRNDLSEVGKHQWENIIAQVIDKFVNNRNYITSLNWAWQNLKEPTCILQIEQPWNNLNNIIEDNEIVWFIAEEIYERPKYWVYGGNVKAIQAVLEDTCSFEYYVVSKKFNWLLCQNHHQDLIISGQDLCDRISKWK